MLSIITAEGELHYSLETARIDGKRSVAFLRQLLRARTRPLIVMADRASFHRSVVVRQFVHAHRSQIRVFFFPTHSPELNPDELVWNEMKHRQIGKQPVKNKIDLKKRLRFALKLLQLKAERIRIYFRLPDTRYAATADA